LDKHPVSLTSWLTVSMIIVAYAMNRQASLCEAVGPIEESRSRRPPALACHRPQGADHPAPRTPMRAGHCGGSPPGPLPRRPHEAGTAIGRAGAPHIRAVQEDPRDLPTLSSRHPHRTANRGIRAIVTREPRAWKLACVFRTEGLWTRSDCTVGTSRQAAPLVAARTAARRLDRG